MLQPTTSSGASLQSDSGSVNGLSDQFREFGHARVPATARSATLAWRVLQLSMRSRGQQIAGQVKQLSLKDKELLAEWTAVAKAAVAAVGATSPEFLVDSKMLIAPPKQGLQAVHWDTARTREAHELFTCILYCSNGAHSTALPTFPTNEVLSFSHDRHAMQKVVHLLLPRHYSSTPAQPGEVAVFRLSTPHFGVANTMPQGNRVVLFGLLSPSHKSGQDSQQVFPWLYTRYAFEEKDQPPKSLEYAWSLVEGREYNPLDRIFLDEGKTARDQSKACLIAHGLLEACHGGLHPKRP